MRATSTLVVFTLVLAACGGESGGEGSESTLQERPQTTPACEKFDYPCDWRDADPEVLEKSLELLDEAADGLAGGQSVEDVAARLEETEGVVAVNWAEEGVVFRMDGGLPVNAFTELASPTYLPVETAVPGETVQGSAPRLVQAKYEHRQAPTILAQSDQRSSYEPTREPDLRPRRVMVLSPTRSADLAASVSASVEAGLTPPSGPPTQTRDTFSASDHFEVLDLPDEQAHPGHWANMAAFDVVVIETHGAYYDCRDDGLVCGLFLAGPLAQPYLESLGIAEDDVDDEAAYRDFGGFTIARISIDDEYHISFSDDFFHRLPGSGVGNSIVIVNACRMGEEAVSTTALASTIAGSRGAVFSWDQGIPGASADATTAVLAKLLVEGADPDAAMEQMRFDDLNTAPYRGIEAELLLYHEPGVSLRARDVVNTYVDGQVAQPGATVAAVGTPDDGQADRIEGVEIRIDGVNRNDRESTTVEIKVDGELLKVVQNGTETTSPILDDSTHREGATSGSWEEHRISLDDAILPFDLTEADVTQGQPHTWEVIVQGATGGPSVHTVDPVIFRLGSVRIVNPHTSFSLEPDGRVFLEGAPADGVAETYPLIVRVEHLDDSAVAAEYSVRVSIDGVEETIQLTHFENLGDGSFRYARGVDIGDLPAEENQVTMSVELIRTSDEGDSTVDEFDPSPIILVLEGRPEGCEFLGSRELSAAMGRPFDGPEPIYLFGGDSPDLCRWSARFSIVDISIVTNDSEEVELMRARAESDPYAVDGFGDAAFYDLELGNALNPSGIEIEGEMQYNNFVILSVVIDDNTRATINVQGNIVVEEDPQSVLLQRLQALVEAIRDSS